MHNDYVVEFLTARPLPWRARWYLFQLSLWLGLWRSPLALLRLLVCGRTGDLPKKVDRRTRTAGEQCSACGGVIR